MLNAAEIVTGMLGGAGADQLTHHINRITGQEQEPGNELRDIVFHLKNIDEALNPTEAPNIDEPMLLQGYPYEYITHAENHKRAHLSVFFGVATAARFDIPGIGSYMKNVGPGWIQCDLPGNTHISTSDGSSKAVIVSYRVDPLGAAL